MKKPKFSADGYLKTTKMGRDGEKITSFEFAASEALEVARLELMSRDQASASKEPVLLRITAEVVYGKNRKTVQEKNHIVKTGRKARRSRID